MTTSTHFPGQLAQEVSPNPKCNNCLHYQANAGSMGACTIGLRPWLCGEGDNQVAGYSPLDRQQPTEPGNMAPGGSAASVGEWQTVPMTLTVLGDEHATMTKSIHDELDAIQKRACDLHQNGNLAVKGYNHNVGAVVCSCKRIASKSISKRLFKALDNATRVHVTEDDVLFFVRGVREGMEPFDIALARVRSDVTEEVSKSINGAAVKSYGGVAKSLYGEDWTTPFLGTDLFDDAAKLRELEIAACEDELKRRIERRKAEKDRAKQATPATDSYDWDAQYAAEEKLRIAKARLMLKLQKHRQKQMAPTKKG